MKKFLSGLCGKMSSINNMQIKSEASLWKCACKSESIQVFKSVCVSVCVCVSDLIFAFPKVTLFIF